MTDIKILPEVKDFIKKGYAHYINGKFYIEGKQKIIVVNPATEELVTELAAATQNEVNKAVDSAYKAFNGSWRVLTPEARQNYLLKLADA